MRGVLALALLAIVACSPQSADYSITFGGDIILTRAGDPLYKSIEGTTNSWGVLEKPQKVFKNSMKMPDYFFANLESPLGAASEPLIKNSDDLNLCSAADQSGVLTKGHLTLVSLVNNHRNDCQINGIEETRRILEQNQILFVGLDLIPAYIETSNGKIAIIAAEDVTIPIDVDSLVSHVKRARQIAQVVIVSVHWGNEYQTGPDSRQQEIAQQLADAGADVIWGHHPHVLQKMEWLNAASGKKTLVFYSLGNLIADQWMLDDAQRTAVVRISFHNSKIVKIQVIPLFMDFSTRRLKSVNDSMIKNQIFQRLKLDTLENRGVVIDY